MATAMTIIYAFGLGLTFVAGAFFGGWLIARGVQGKLTEEREKWLEHSERVETRLEKYIENTGSIAATLKELIARKA